MLIFYDPLHNKDTSERKEDWFGRKKKLLRAFTSLHLPMATTSRQAVGSSARKFRSLSRCRVLEADADR